MSNIRIDFWRNDREWPRDSSKFIFLARVVQTVGNRLFPGQWTGLEPQIKLLPKIPEEGDSDIISNYTVKKLLDPKAFYDDDEPKTVFGWSAGGRLRVSAEERAKARMLVAEDHAEKQPGLRRFAVVKQRIISLAEEGRLVTAVRALAGGEFSELPSSYWNAENLERRFALCQMKFGKPFGPAAGGESFYWIFVSKASLERTIKSLKKRGGAKTGRVEKYDWEEGKLYLHKLLEENGDFKDPLNRRKGWQSQNDAVSLVIEHLAKISNDDGPSPSAVKAKVRDWLEEFRSGQ
jgi:hypothetical protein